MIIDTDKSLRKFMKELDRKKQAFAFDTETTGLRYWDGDRIVGVSFFIPDDPHQKTSEGECYYLPFRHKKGKNLDLSAMKQLSVVFAKPENVAVGFNTQFDVNMLGADGVMVNNKVLDVMLAAHLANENQRPLPRRRTNC
jgi:DNA polymerase I-like protein with 3'-5' exonuclease and polymerase domains